MSVKSLVGSVDPESLANTYTNIRRRQMAEAISESSGSMTQVEAIDFIRDTEDTVLEEFEQNGDPVPDYVLRAMTQSVVIDKLVEKMTHDEEES